MSAASPLDALHPDGAVRRIHVVGGGPPGSLLPASASAATSAADLALVSPAAADLRRPGWVRRAIREAASATRDDGVVYVLVPRRARRRAAAELRRVGLVGQTHLAHLPAGEPLRYLVPLQRPAWAYAMSSVISARPVARHLLSALGAVPFGLDALRLALPAVGILAARGPGPAPAAWVSRLEGSTGDVRHAVVAASFRGGAGATVLHCFAPGAERPWGVVKVAPGPTREDERLAALATGAAGAGARVPRVLARGLVDGRTVVAETVVAGRPAADLLARDPDRAGEIVAAVAEWLGRWGAATRTDGSAAARLATGLLDDAAALSTVVADGDRYWRWLADRCAALGEDEVPFVARHNDLTMWNVLVDADSTIGVLDWGEAEAAGLPLTDFFYAVVDAVAASRRYDSRLQAVRDCFSVSGAALGPAAGHRERLTGALGVSERAAALCFHACWLHHARREVAAAGPDGGFLSIVRWLASRTPAKDRCAP